MTDYAQYLGDALKNPGYRSRVDELLDRLPNEAADAARSWLADNTNPHSQVARALETMGRDLVTWDKRISPDCVSRWRNA